MGKVYKITVIGAGDRGNCYMSTIKEFHNDDVEFLGICDILEDRAKSAMEKYGFKEKFSDYKEAITKTKPDIVVIATPAYYHCDIAEFAMENDCHVLTEKPFDLDMKKCFALKEVQKRTGKVLAIGLQYRNDKGHRAMKHLIDRKILGDNVIVSYIDTRENRPKIAMHDAKFGNGGPMTDMACHLFDLLRWFYNCDPKSVNAVWKKSAVNRPNLKDIEVKAPDTCIMTIEYESGDFGVITMNWGLPTKNKEFFQSMAIGSEGFVNPRSPGEKDIVVNTGADEIKIGTLAEDDKDLRHCELAVYDHFIEEIEGKGKSQASFDEGIVSLATTMAAIKSGIEGRTVTIEEILKLKPTIADCMGE